MGVTKSTGVAAVMRVGPGGAWECSHGWSDAERRGTRGADRAPLMHRPGGAKEVSPEIRRPTTIVFRRCHSLAPPGRCDSRGRWNHGLRFVRLRGLRSTRGYIPAPLAGRNRRDIRRSTIESVAGKNRHAPRLARLPGFRLLVIVPFVMRPPPDALAFPCAPG